MGSENDLILNLGNAGILNLIRIEGSLNLGSRKLSFIPLNLSICLMNGVEGREGYSFNLQ